MKTNAQLCEIIRRLRKHLASVDDAAAREQAIHRYLNQFGLAPAEHFAVLDSIRD